MAIALSHSRVSDYDQCPLKFKFKYLDKNEKFQIKDDQKSPALVKGQKVHKYLEDYVNDVKEDPSEVIKKSSLPEVENGKDLADQFISQYGPENTFAELQLAIDVNWQPVEWFSREAYYRSIVDMSCYSLDKIAAIDWKTGKFRAYTPDSGYGQLELTAGMMFALKAVPTVETVYAYVDHRKIIAKEYSINEFNGIRDYFDRKHDQVNAETEWLPKRNQFCKWCEATKSMCPFSSKPDI